MQRACALTIVLLVAGAISCGTDTEDAPKPNPNSINTLVHDGLTRSFLLHVPPGYSGSTRAPLVIALHGHGSTAVKFEQQSGLSNKADAEGFIVAYPNGLPYPWTTENLQAWNVGGPYEEWTRGTDDIGFIDDMLELVRRHYSIDDSRVFVTGHSNGSRMVYRVGYQLSCKLAAIAPHSGQMLYTSESPARCPVPVLHLHAINDATALYDGATSADPRALSYPPVDTLLGTWASMFGCSTSPEITAVTSDYLVKKWKCPTGYPDVELYLASRGGHSWLTTANSGLPATDLIWEFFEAHPKR